MATSSTIQLGDQEYSVERLRLRKWLELEDIRAKIISATEDLSIDRFVESVYAYVFMVTEAPRLHRLPWYEVAGAYIAITELNSPKADYPLLRTKTDNSKVAWDYEGRTWYIWSHSLASAYGWTIEYIENLDIDDAIAMLQEIMIQEQLEKEFEYGLSEIAYVYDPTSKKSKFKPLERPNWMELISSNKLKKVKIIKSMLPVGNVVNLGKMDGSLKSE